MPRMETEVAILVLNAIVTVGIAYLSYRLLKVRFRPKSLSVY